MNHAGVNVEYHKIPSTTNIAFVYAAASENEADFTDEDDDTATSETDSVPSTCMSSEDDPRRKYYQSMNNVKELDPANIKRNSPKIFILQNHSRDQKHLGKEITGTIMNQLNHNHRQTQNNGCYNHKQRKLLKKIPLFNEQSKENASKKTKKYLKSSLKHNNFLNRRLSNKSFHRRSLSDPTYSNSHVTSNDSIEMKNEYNVRNKVRQSNYFECDHTKYSKYNQNYAIMNKNHCELEIPQQNRTRSRTPAKTSKKTETDSLPMDYQWRLVVRKTDENGNVSCVLNKKLPIDTSQSWPKKVLQYLENYQNEENKDSRNRRSSSRSDYHNNGNESDCDYPYDHRNSNHSFDYPEMIRRHRAIPPRSRFNVKQRTDRFKFDSNEDNRFSAETDKQIIVTNPPTCRNSRRNSSRNYTTNNNRYRQDRSSSTSSSDNDHYIFCKGRGQMIKPRVNQSSINRPPSSQKNQEKRTPRKNFSNKKLSLLEDSVSYSSTWSDALYMDNEQNETESDFSDKRFLTSGFLIDDTKDQNKDYINDIHVLRHCNCNTCLYDGPDIRRKERNMIVDHQFYKNKKCGNRSSAKRNTYELPSNRRREKRGSVYRNAYASQRKHGSQNDHVKNMHHVNKGTERILKEIESLIQQSK